LSKKKTEGFWSGTVQCGAVDIFIKLVGSRETDTLANGCYFLGYLIMEDVWGCSKVLNSRNNEATLEVTWSW
jgi:hypothetical protein